MEEIDRFRRLAGAANRKARPVWERQRVAEYLADWKYAEFALAELDANETLDLSVEPLIKLTRMLDLHGDSQVLDEMEQERDEDFDTGGATKQCEYAVLTALRLLRGVQPAIRKARELLLQARHALGAKVRRNGLAKALNRIGIELCKRYPIPGFAKVDLRTYAAFGPGVRPKTESLAARVPAPAPSTTDSSGFNGQGPAKFANADIPTEKRTRPMTLSEAARYMGYTKGQKGSGKRAPAKRVSGGIKSGAIPAIRRNRQTYIFNIDNFPAAALKRVLPTE